MCYATVSLGARTKTTSVDGWVKVVGKIFVGVVAGPGGIMCTGATCSAIQVNIQAVKKKARWALHGRAASE